MGVGAETGAVGTAGGIGSGVAVGAGARAGGVAAANGGLCNAVTLSAGSDVEVLGQLMASAGAAGGGVQYLVRSV